MCWREADTVNVKNDSAEQTRFCEGLFASVRLIIGCEPSCNLIPELFLHDRFVLAGITVIAVHGLPDVDAIVEQVIEGTPRVACAPGGTPAPARANFAVYLFPSQIVFELFDTGHPQMLPEDLLYTLGLG